MNDKLLWLAVFVGFYWLYCLFWGIKGAKTSKTSEDYFLAGRNIGLWVFVLAATATSFSGWTFVGHPGKIFTDGLPYAFASFYALTIPFTGVLFIRRQWILGKAYKYITPGEMYSDYYGGNAIRFLTVLVAFLFSVPYLGVQLRASGDLFNIITDGLVPVNFGMIALSTVVVIYVASGGLRSVAYVDSAQCILLAVGICVIGTTTIYFSGGWNNFISAFHEVINKDLVNKNNLTPSGHSSLVAIPGSIQFVSNSSKSIGGPWTGMMCLTYMFALMGIQASPAFSMWAFSNKNSSAFRWQQVVASSLIIGIILFTFTIIQGIGGHVLVLNDVIQNVNDKNLVPKLINLLSSSFPWLVGLLAVCALAAMQSTGSGYMSTFSAMVIKDIYLKFLNKNASDKNQKNSGRLIVIMIAIIAIFVAANTTSAIVMLGGLAVAYGFQMYPALLGICYFKWFSTRGIVFGLIAGLITVTLTDKTSIWFGLPWGSYPLTIHSAGWGIFVNLIVTITTSFFIKDDKKRKKIKNKRHEFLSKISVLSEKKKKFVPLAWILTMIWFLVGFGPFATIGNSFFSNPNQTITWSPFGLPSIWIWQLFFLGYGIFVMWFLAFYMELSKPVKEETIQKYIN